MTEEDGIPDVEEVEDEDEDVINETMFTFEAFEAVRALFQFHINRSPEYPEIRFGRNYANPPDLPGSFP